MKFQFSTFSILTLFICMSIIGLGLIPLLNIQLKPSKTNNSLNIRFGWSNASARIIEQEVTSKLEGVFNTIKGVKKISSDSKKGNGNIRLEFKKHTDMDAIRFEVASLIRQSYTDLPNRVSYPQISSRRNDLDDKKNILSYNINANESPYYIKKYVEKKITPQLDKIKEINEVSIYGATSYEWVITYNTDQLLQLQLSKGTISGAINKHLSKQQLGIGQFFSLKDEEKGTKETPITMIYNSSEDINFHNIPIKKIGDRIIYLRDIATIRFKEAPVRSYHRINGLNSISMVIYAEEDSNTIELAKKVKKIVSEIKAEIQSEGYTLKLTNDTTEYLTEEITKIERRTLYSLLILLVLILAMNKGIKYMTILLLSIVVNLSIAIIFYYLFHVKLHMYSFAGITISFGIVIDNSIIMIDHMKNKGDKKAFLAILAATMTTIAALLIVFFLKEEQRLNLWDFSLVIAINIGVSLGVSLFFIPALLDKFQLQNKKIGFSKKQKRRVLKFNNIYRKSIFFCKRKWIKTVLILLFIFGFGIPLDMTPEKIKGDKFGVELYNNTLGNKWFFKEVKPTLEKYIGGTLRLFTQEVFANSYNSDPERTTLRVRASMPEGCTVSQLDEAVEEMENLISKYDEVSLYETNINSPQNSNITIYFKEKHEFGNFPFSLKNILESKAISLGGADWSVTGVGRGFSNSLGGSYKSNKITLEGYNYDELYGYAELLKEQLVKNSGSRIKEVEIKNKQRSSSPSIEYYLDFDLSKIADLGITQRDVYNYLQNQVYSGSIKSIVNDNEWQQVKLTSNQYLKFNVWDLKNTPLWIHNKQYKLNQLATIEQRNSGNSISKNNQQYSLTVAYDFIGTHQLAKKVKDENIREIREKLPIGFKINQSSYRGWKKEDINQYFALFIVILIIFFICAILLESLKQPFAIISMIPIAFIGVFLTFYLFEFNFDQGGYASFILLCGISVNSALYIINDFNNLKIQYPNRSINKLYFKAFNYKIIPILLTIISTIVGLIPFVWNGQNEAFWFSFAVGSIGGLVFSLLGILLYLPLFILKADKKNLNLINPKNPF